MTSGAAPASPIRACRGSFRSRALVPARPRVVALRPRRRGCRHLSQGVGVECFDGDMRAPRELRQKNSKPSWR